MKIVKLLQYSVCYGKKIIYSNTDVDIIDASDITDLDTNANSVFEELYRIYHNLIDYILIDDNVISKLKLHIGLITGKLTMKFCVSYNNPEKCVDGYDEKYTECSSHDEYFKKYCRGIEYDVNMIQESIFNSRYECYGPLDTTMLFPEVYKNRYELSDNYIKESDYKVGDIITLKFPIQGKYKYIITENINDGIRFRNLHKVSSLDGRILLWDGYEIHDYDIDKVIDHDINKAYKCIMTHLSAYSEEYIDKAKQMVKDESK